MRKGGSYLKQKSGETKLVARTEPRSNEYRTRPAKPRPAPATTPASETASTGPKKES